MLNKVQLIGHVGSDPEIKTTSGGTEVCNLRLATTEKWTTKDGEKHEETEWHKIVLWNQSASFAGKYVFKGSKIYIEGKVKTRKWTDSEGVDHYSTEIQAERIMTLDKKSDAPETAKPSAHEKAKANAYQPQDEDF